MNRKARRSLKATEFDEYVKFLEVENRDLRIEVARLRRLERAVMARVQPPPQKSSVFSRLFSWAAGVL